MQKFKAAIAMLLAIVMAISSGVNVFAAGPKYIEEVRLRYGDTASVSAFGMLNRFYEDDSGLGLGEFLTTYVDDAGQLTKLFMQSNQSVMSFMFYLLALGCTDSSETGNWLYKFSIE